MGCFTPSIPSYSIAPSMHSMPGPSFGLRSNLSNHMRSSEDTLPHAILVSHFLMTAVHCRQRHHWKKTWPSKYRKDIEKNACLTAVLIDCRFITYRTYCVYCITESYLSPLYKTSQRPSLLYPFDCCFPTIPRSWKSLGIVQPQKIPEMSSCCSGVLHVKVCNLRRIGVKLPEFLG